jgi:hypothetical protein
MKCSVMLAGLLIGGFFFWAYLLASWLGMSDI